MALLATFDRDAAEAFRAGIVSLAAISPTKMRAVHGQTEVTEVLAVFVGEACVAEGVDQWNTDKYRITPSGDLATLPSVGAAVGTGLSAALFDLTVVHRDTITRGALWVVGAGAEEGAILSEAGVDARVRWRRVCYRGLGDRAVRPGAVWW